VTPGVVFPAGFDFDGFVKGESGGFRVVADLGHIEGDELAEFVEANGAEGAGVRTIALWGSGEGEAIAGGGQRGHDFGGDGGNIEGLGFEGFEAFVEAVDLFGEGGDGGVEGV
jgi:hypothetical protein